MGLLSRSVQRSTPVSSGNVYCNQKSCKEATTKELFERWPVGGQSDAKATRERSGKKRASENGE
jgi:hypothetical protein